MNAEIKVKAKSNDIPLTRSEVGNTVTLIGKDIKSLRNENKHLRELLVETRSRVILLEENYITLLQDLSRSAKTDLLIYTIFAICIVILGFIVYGLTH